MGKQFYSFSSKNKYYALRKGRNPGIYYSWEECKAQIHKYSGAIFKSFESYEEAEEYINNYNNNYKSNYNSNYNSIYKRNYNNNSNYINKNQLKSDYSYAHINSYFNNIEKYYGYNGYIYYNDTKYIITGYGNNYKYINMRNI